MEVQTDKTTNNDAKRKKLNAHLGLAGIFFIVYVVIFAALVMRVNLITLKLGVTVLSESASYIMFALALLIILAALYMYTIVSRSELLKSLKEAGAIMSVFAVVITANIFLAALNPYLMLVSLTALLALPFSKKRDAFILNVFACLISSFTLVNMRLEGFFAVGAVMFTALAGILSGAIGVYAFPSAIKRTAAILRSFVTGLCNVFIYCVLLCTYSIDVTPFVNNVYYILIAAAGDVLLSNLIVPIVESVFNIATDFKLIELTNHKAPLIHRLIVEAPGTFNHSLAVANFAEICANAIGEDPYLARACAYYHDIGKLNNGMYFVENQAGYNPHDDILPEVSAEIIRQHTIDGYNLCKKYRIPEEVARITIQHHGTLPITYFYNKAKTLTDSEVDMDEYRYGGETPTGKIGAIIMICDSAEAAIRAMDKPDGERVDRLLKNMIDERIKLGQFDNCDITMNDLTLLREAIVGGYGGLFHSRIKYNNGSVRDNAHV